MSNYQEGYDKGYEDAKAGNERRYNILDYVGILQVDPEAEEEWREGYNDGYDAGEEEKENDE